MCGVCVCVCTGVCVCACISVLLQLLNAFPNIITYKQRRFNQEERIRCQIESESMYHVYSFCLQSIHELNISAFFFQTQLKPIELIQMMVDTHLAV